MCFFIRTVFSGMRYGPRASVFFLGKPSYILFKKNINECNTMLFFSDYPIVLKYVNAVFYTNNDLQIESMSLHCATLHKYKDRLRAFKSSILPILLRKLSHFPFKVAEGKCIGSVFREILAFNIK